MGAPTKLNVAYLNGAMVIAVIVGSAFGSIWVFGIALAVLVVGMALSGELRFKRRE